MKLLTGNDRLHLGGGFKHCFMFTPEMIQFDGGPYFSRLKPPASQGSKLDGCKFLQVYPSISAVETPKEPWLTQKLSES